MEQSACFKLYYDVYNVGEHFWFLCVCVWVCVTVFSIAQLDKRRGTISSLIPQMLRVLMTKEKVQFK